MKETNQNKTVLGRLRLENLRDAFYYKRISLPSFCHGQHRRAASKHVGPAFSGAGDVADVSRFRKTLIGTAALFVWCGLRSFDTVLH